MKFASNYARTLLLLAPTITLSSISIPQVYAQDLILEEIIVTARKREESLQETPIAVSAYNGRSLREAGIDSMDDLNAIVPGIDLKGGSGTSGRASIYIRGVGQRNTGPNIDSGVGIYLDGIYLSRADGALLDINDIGSIQVLRGPQGTLFGKNTTGGALVFETNRPTDEFESSLMLRGGNYDRRDGSLMLNVPLGDTLATRLSLTAIKRDGYMRNLTTGVDHNDEDRMSGVWQLRWTPSDTLTLDLNANYTKTQQTARAQKCLPIDGIEGWQGPGFDALLGNSTFATTTQGLCDISAEAGEYEWTGDVGRSASYFSETKGVSVTANWDINDNLSFKSITGWRETVGASENDLDPTAAHLTFISGLEHPEAVPDKTHQITQELQLTGQAFDGKMNFVTGAFYFTEETDERAEVSEVAAVEIAVLPGRIFTLTSNRTELLADNDSWAVYSQVDWNFNDNWRATLGARYTSEDRKLFRRRASLDPNTLSTVPGPVIPVGAGVFLLPEAGSYNTAYGFREDLAEETRGSESATEFTPMASIQYLWEGNGFVNSGTAYFTFSQGFLSGGLSEAPRASPDLDGDGLTDDTDGDGIPNGADFDRFVPEEVTNFELGVKLDAWDNRLRMNAALFYTDYDNRQLTTIVINPVTNSPAGATFNAKSSSITGFELETTILPFGQMEITLNASIYDGKIKEYEDIRLSLVDVPAGQDCVADGIGVQIGPGCVLSQTIDRSDEDLARLPEKSLFLGMQYRFKGDFGTIVPRIQLSKKYNVEHCFERGSCESGFWNTDETDLSARLSWISPSENYRISLYGTNLTDTRDIIGGQPLVDSYGFGGITFNAPRMYGAELQVSF